MAISREQLIEEILKMAKKRKEERTRFIAELKKIFPELDHKDKESEK